jgi:CRISPR-associated protein Csb2
LKARHRALSGRFTRVGAGRAAVTEFRQPPRPQSRAVAYDAPPGRLLYELRPSTGADPFAPVRRQDAVHLVKAVRDLAVARLAAVGDAAVVERAVLGRGEAVDPARRVRFIPLPSIGMRYTSPSIRRLLVEVPPDCPLTREDLAWALNGRGVLEDVDPADGIVLQETLLTPTRDDVMARRYGVGRAYERWRTVTPVVLPEGRERTRGRTSGRQRVDAEHRAAAAVLTALHQAGVAQRPTEVAVQREPFQRNGVPADRFDPDRFDRRRLTHVALTFAEPIAGPLLIGDGRFLGLGLFARADSVDR